MPDRLKAGIEALTGIDMSDVRVHTNSSKPSQLRALAYAQGNEIHLAPGQERHLAHESWHIVQQRQGRVRPTLYAGGVAVNDDPGLEREADIMGERAHHHGLAAASASAAGPSRGRSQPVQRVTETLPPGLDLHRRRTAIARQPPTYDVDRSGAGQTCPISGVSAEKPAERTRRS